MSKATNHARIIIKVSIVTIAANLLLTVIKVVLGLVFGNLSVISDGIHSASDLFTSFLIILAVFLSSPKRDEKHNYGHEKVEPLITLFLALILAGVGATLLWQGIEGVISPSVAEINYYLIGTIVLSIVVKEAMFWYEIYYAKKLNNQMLKADAWHSRSDALSSIAVLIGLICSIFMTTNLIESIAVIIVSLFIFKVAFDVLKPAINQLIDKAAPIATTTKIRDIASAVEGVSNVDLIRSRMFGNRIYVDIEIAVDGNLTVEQSHSIAQSVHDKLEATEDLYIKHCMVHVNPSSDE
jgi:cation diffusion facilitator family transporter